MSSKTGVNNLKAEQGAPVRLHPPQRAVVQRYAGAVFSAGSFRLFNERMPEFQDMVLSLPSCRDLSEADVVSIAADGLLAFYELQRQEKIRTGKYADVTRELSDHYTRFLESLPRPYRLRVSLPRVSGLGECILRLSPAVVIRGSEGMVAGPSAQSSLFGRIAAPPSGSATLEISVAGFATSSLETQGAADALALAKQTAFLLVSAGLMQSASWGTEQSTAVLFDVVKNSEERLTLPEGLARLFSRLELVKEMADLRNTGKGLLSDPLEAGTGTGTERQSALASKMAPVARFFERSQSPGHQRIAAGMEWYQDSVAGPDQTIAFLAACIGIEAVLGEEEGGLTELSRRLADRYSFMLGKDRADRSRLAREFDAVLKLRGELVHARSTRLRARDRDRLREVQLMLWNLLQHELRPFTAE